MQQVRERGTVKCFNQERGYGFAHREGREDIFIHASGLRDIGVKVKLAPGVTVEFEVSSTPKGLCATDVELL